ncbi:hypothetical protein FB45DRAFT_357429 [Roridomyces roridus]|uniref:Uncharacterized protein n=1 Tax=Roridomyces roridus TaxID=1738132 RepID=A0AAD7C9I2_9AGAR|nr:hypothetical protein FB45DRAFT_357429 [Roridomyces roridus]
MGVIFSCIAGIFACIGDCIMSIISLIAGCLECIIASAFLSISRPQNTTDCAPAIADCLAAIANCLTCGACSCVYLPCSSRPL